VRERERERRGKRERCEEKVADLMRRDIGIS